MLLDGLHVPLTTPFYPDGRVYLRKLEHNADRASRTPAAGLVVLGTLGEPESLSDDEMREVLAVAAGATAKEKVLIAGIAQEGVREAVRLAEHAAGCGYDAVLLRTPRAWPLQMWREGEGSAELLTFFRAVADQSPLPVILNNAPRLIGYDLPVETIAVLAKHGNVIGIAEASEATGRIEAVLQATADVKREVTVTTVFAAVTGRMLKVEVPVAGNATFVSAVTLGSGAAVATAPPRPALKTRTRTVGFQVLAAGAVDCFAALRAGAAGIVPNLAACAPQACHEVLAAWKDGDPKLAAEKYVRIRGAAAQMDELGLGALKFACDLNGYFGGRPRLPLLPPSGEEQEEITRLLQEIRN